MHEKPTHILCNTNSEIKYKQHIIGHLEPLLLEENQRRVVAHALLWHYEKPNRQTRTRGHSLSNSTLSTYRLMAALTLCSLQFALLAFPLQATPISFTDAKIIQPYVSPLCTCVCVCVNEWMNEYEFNLIDTSKSQEIFAWINQIEMKDLNMI